MGVERADDRPAGNAATHQEVSVSIVVRFSPNDVTRAKYDEVVRRLEEAGEWPNPPGLEFHVLYGSEGNLRVDEIWDSPESRGLLPEDLPVMNEVGSEMTSEPEVFEVQNIARR